MGWGFNTYCNMETLPTISSSPPLSSLLLLPPPPPPHPCQIYTTAVTPRSQVQLQTHSTHTQTPSQGGSLNGRFKINTSVEYCVVRSLEGVCGCQCLPPPFPSLPLHSHPPHPHTHTHTTHTHTHRTPRCCFKTTAKVFS